MDNDELIIDGQAVSLSDDQDTAATLETEKETTDAQQSNSALADESANEGKEGDDNPEPREDGEPGDEETEEELSLVIGDEEISLTDDNDLIDGKPAPEWVKELRKQHQETQKANEELRRQLAETKAVPPPQSIDEIPAKPTLESCDWDEQEFETQLAQWHEQKTSVEQAKQHQQQQQQQFQQQFQQRIDAHRQRAEKLPVNDYAAMEEIVRAEMPDMHKEVLIHSADDGSELIAYALGKNPVLRKRLSAEKDPLRVAYQLGQLSTKVKLAPKVKKTAKPEPSIKGGAGNAKSDEFNKLCPGAVIE